VQHDGLAPAFDLEAQVEGPRPVRQDARFEAPFRLAGHPPLTSGLRAPPRPLSALGALPSSAGSGSRWLAERYWHRCGKMPPPCQRRKPL
jgi:hypothetical protein